MRDFDLTRFDAFGNFLEVPDLELPEEHGLCKRFENTSKLFRVFSGLLLFDEKTREYDFRFKNLDAIEFNFDRLESLFYKVNSSIFNEEDEEEDEDEDDQDLNSNAIDSSSSDLSRFELKASIKRWETLHEITRDSAIRLKRSFPHIYRRDVNLSVEQLAIGELFVIDFVDLVFPTLRHTQISSVADLAGFLVFLVLIREQQGLGSASSFPQKYIEFFDLMNRFSGHQLDLKLSFNEYTGALCAEDVLESLLVEAFNKKLFYTMELFYAFKIIDFNSEQFLHAAILTNSDGGVFLNRLFDFVDFKQKMSLDSRKTPLLHHIFDMNPKLIRLLFDHYEVDWSIGEYYYENDVDVDVDVSSGRTIFRKLIDLSSKSAFEYESAMDQFENRMLLAELMSKMKIEDLLINRSPDMGLFEACLENEVVGLRLLKETFFTGSEGGIYNMSLLASHILNQILQTWRQDGSVFRLVPVAQYLVRNYYGLEDLKLLNEMMTFLGGLVQSSASPLPSPRSKSTSSNRSISRSSSSDFFRGLFSLKSSNSQESIVAVIEEVTIPSGVQNQVLDLMRLIISLAENSPLAKDAKVLEMINSWKSLI